MASPTPISTTSPVSVTTTAGETNVLTYSNVGGCNLQGFAASGDGPGRFLIRVGGTGTNGTSYYPYRTSQADRNALVIFPAFAVAAGTQIYVNVVNDEDTVAHNYEATIMLA